MVDITDKSAVCEENQIHVPEDKLKEEQKKEFESWWRNSNVNASSRTASTDLAK